MLVYTLSSVSVARIARAMRGGPMCYAQTFRGRGVAYIVRLPRLRAESGRQRDGDDHHEPDDNDGLAGGLVDVAETFRRRRRRVSGCSCRDVRRWRRGNAGLDEQRARNWLKEAHFV